MRSKNVMKVFKNFAISGKIIFLLIFISSINPKVCKSEGFFTPYRLFFGLKKETTKILSTLSDRERGLGYGHHTEKSLIFYEETPISPSWATLEFSPNYLFDTIGYYIFVSNRKFDFYVEDYPKKGRDQNGKVNTTTFGIPFYLYFGDKTLGKEGNFYFRFGLGPSINWLSEIEFKEIDSETYSGQEGLASGLTTLIELFIGFFAVKLEQTEYETIGVYPDKITIVQNDSSIGFYYYF